MAEGRSPAYNPTMSLRDDLKRAAVEAFYDGAFHVGAVLGRELSGHFLDAVERYAEDHPHAVLRAARDLEGLGHHFRTIVRRQRREQPRHERVYYTRGNPPGGKPN